MLHSKLKTYILLLFLPLLILSCQQQKVINVNEYWDMSAEKRDSLDFIQLHHYSINYNFLLTADSLLLNPLSPNNSETFSEITSSIVVRKGDKLVVAATAYTLNDSTKKRTYFVKVARDQNTMGWVEEEFLQKNVVPCDPISQFIHTFSNNYIFGFVIIIVMALLFFIYRLKRHQHIPFVHFQDIDSIYPATLCVTTAFAAMLYGTIRSLMPNMWEDYYYSPTLNPIGQPFILGTFLVSVWVMVILFIATLEETHRQLKHSDMVIYLLGLGCCWIIIYVVFSQSVHIYLGYPLFIVYLIFAWLKYQRHHIAHYLCGKCGKPIHTLGRCPHCGAFNK